MLTGPTTAQPGIDPDPLNQMQRYLVQQFVEDYQDGLLSRRDLIAKIGRIAGGTLAATTILTWFGVPTGEVGAQWANWLRNAYPAAELVLRPSR